VDDEQLIESGLAGRLRPGTPEFDRFVDITARRPSGEAGAAHYLNPEEHEKSFTTALDALELTPADRYLELGIGGGQLLERALETVRSAVGVDHSPDMLVLTRARNAEAVTSGRLRLLEGDVHDLPLRDGEFTSVACVNAFFFIERPAEFLAEVHRMLAEGGRFVLVTALPGGNSSSGPWGPALRTYEPEVLRAMLVDAGFADPTVGERDGQQVAVATA
jgi:ubiquinone/menaquinone biosynthesis C-methylase UbiE